MGYRSEVCIGFTDAAGRLFKTMLDHLPDDHEVRDLVKDAEQNFTQNILDKAAPLSTERLSDYEGKLYWNYVKWYQRFDDVGFIEDFLSAIPDEDYRFVRIGEDQDDSENRGEYYDAEIYINRSISW